MTTVHRPRATVTINSAAIERIATGPDGQALLRRKAAVVASLARQFAARNGSMAGFARGADLGKSGGITGVLQYQAA